MSANPNPNPLIPDQVDVIDKFGVNLRELVARLECQVLRVWRHGQ